MRKTSAKAKRKGVAFKIVASVIAIASVLVATGFALNKSYGWTPKEPFVRNAPEVDDAIRSYEAKRYPASATTLEDYLGTGPCSDVSIGLPDLVRERPNASIDLGLALFAIAEEHGLPFGDEEQVPAAPKPQDGQAESNIDPTRNSNIECALVLLRAVSANETLEPHIRAEARYLAGNLEFLRKKYEDAVLFYNGALRLAPALDEAKGTDPLGRNAAHNRAIALRRILEKKQQEPQDQEQQNQKSQDKEEKPQENKDESKGKGEQDKEQPKEDKPEGDKDKEQPKDQENKSDSQEENAKLDDASQEQASPKPRSATQDDRILSELEQAPSYQEEEAKAKANMRRSRVNMEDK